MTWPNTLAYWTEELNTSKSHTYQAYEIFLSQKIDQPSPWKITNVWLNTPAYWTQEYDTARIRLKHQAYILSKMIALPNESKKEINISVLLYYYQCL